MLPPVARTDEARARRLRRWGRRLGIGLAVFGASLALGLLVLAHSLDSGWIKARVQSLAHGSGVDLDYASADLRWFSGLTIEGLVVQSPPAFRAVAPELARVGRLEARWSLGSLFGSGPKVASLAVSGVAIVVVMDENGRTSFDALSPPGTLPPPAKASVPLSHQAADALGSAPAARAIDLQDVRVALVRTDHGRVVERDSLGGVQVSLVVEPAGATGNGGWRVRANAGTPEAPLDLAIAREVTGAPTALARTRFWLGTDATGSDLGVQLDSQMIEQSFAAGVPAGNWLHAEAAAHFDPVAGKTTVTVQRTNGAGGAITAEASIEVPDQGDPIVRHAHGEVDAAKLLAWTPPGLVPLTVERAHLVYRVDALVLGSTPRFGDGGQASVDADLAQVHFAGAGGPVEVSGGKATLRALPRPEGGLVARGSIALDAIKVATGDAMSARDVAIDLDAAQAEDGAVTGRVGAQAGAFDREGATPIAVRDAHVEVRVDGLHVAPAEPLTSRGEVTVAGGLASLDLRTGTTEIAADDLGLQAHTRLDGHAPYAFEAALPVSRLKVVAPGARTLADGATRVDVAVESVTPDLDHPAASRGTAHLALAYGGDRLTLDAKKSESAVDYTLDATGPDASALRPLLSAIAEAVPLGAMAFHLHSEGHAAGVTSSRPSLEETSDLTVEHAAYANVSAQSVTLKVHSRGDAVQHAVDADLGAAGLVVDKGAPSTERIKISAAIDRARPSLRFQLDSKGRVTTKVEASASFDRARKAIAYDLRGRFADLAPLAPLLAKIDGVDGLDVSQLDVNVASRGEVLGVLAGAGADGTLALAPHPTKTVAVNGTLDIGVAHFGWSGGGTSVASPNVKIHADLEVADARRTFAGHVDVDAVHLGLGDHVVDLAGIHDDATAIVTGDLRDPDTEITQRADVRAVEQDFVPGYPVANVSLALDGSRDAEGLVHITEIKFVNGAGGTSSELTGGIDLGPGRRRLSMTAKLAQDLAPLSFEPARFKGHGQLAAEAQLESPDLEVFRARANLKVAGATIEMPKYGVGVESADGSVPVTLTFEIGKRGFRMHHEAEGNPYSMLRFADQHPLLSRTGFLSIKSIKTPFVSIAPLVGNLEIEQNMVSLRQFEMGVRGGKITGQCGVNWNGAKSTAELHVRAAGVQSSHGEPFDGNIAVVISAADRTVEGRAEVLRIGTNHLRDLLDLEDPLHADPGMNRIRTLLVFGYPKHLRLLFDHGFASVKIELGGLASLVSLNELRGLPMGPLIDKAIGPILDAADTSEEP
ncbi:MAG TPA: hypothetical protein VHV30_14535 [Polyangiaceae bacterium]|nr:hypothetical protein [Polyangiaceae bacterium]